MLLIDTHTHLFHQQFTADREAVMARAQQVCSHVLLPAIDWERMAAVDALAEAYPGFALPMAGLHPTDVPADPDALLDQFEARLATGRYIAVGETGLDLHWEPHTAAQQQRSLRRHLEWAVQFDLPIVLHSRKAFWETAQLVAEAQDRSGGRVRGVFHCFVDGQAEAERAVQLGFHLGIGGVLTYKNTALLAEALRQVPLDRLVLETDSPYLPPVPHRGQRNESSYLPLVAQKLAEVLGKPEAEIADTTTRNAKLLFRLA